MQQGLVHTLVSVTPAPGLHCHAYIVCKKELKREMAELVSAEMMDAIEKTFPPYPMQGILLSTTLDTGTEIVHRILEKSADWRKVWSEGTDFHRTIWTMHEADPDDKKLMELH